MTGEKCNITLSSKQALGPQTETTTEEYTGAYIDRGTKRYLSYKRQTEEGYIDCLLSYGANRLTMTQKGAVNSKMEFAPGRSTTNLYDTPAGTLELTVYTRHMIIDHTGDMIKITLDYDLIAGGEPINTIIDITVDLT